MTTGVTERGAAEVLAAVAASAARLPGAALTAFTGYALADPNRRRAMQVALLQRADLPTDLVARLAAGPAHRRPPAVVVAYLLRGHDRATLRSELDAEPRGPVWLELAGSPRASTELLEELAGRGGFGIVRAVLTHPGASDAARLAALVHLDALGSRHPDNALLAEAGAKAFTDALDTIRVAVHPRLARRALPTVAHPQLRAVLAEQAAAADRGPKVTELLRRRPGRRRRTRCTALTVAGLPWVTAADRAIGDPEVAAAVGDLMAATLDENTAGWAALLALADQFPGTAAELVATAAGVGATPARA